MKKTILTLVAAMLLGGCASTNEEFVCAGDTDWNQLGLTTASEGKTVRTFERYKATCGDKLPANAKDAYLDGYTVGIKEYCSYENGFKIGSLGLENPYICPFEIRKDFDKGFEIGMLDRREKQKNLELAEREKDRRLINSGASMGDKQ